MTYSKTMGAGRGVGGWGAYSEVLQKKQQQQKKTAAKFARENRRPN